MKPPCDYAVIQSVVDQASIPVVGNGDIADFTSYQRMKTRTACDGFMVARAGVGRPWLFAALTAERQGQVFVPPSLPEIGELLLMHVQGLIMLESEKSSLAANTQIG